MKLIELIIMIVGLTIWIMVDRNNYKKQKAANIAEVLAKRGHRYIHNTGDKK